MTLRDSIETIAKQAVAADIYFNGCYEFKTGIFNPLNQTVQGISIADASVLNNIKLYSVAGIKYSVIPPGTGILVGFANADPGRPYVAGIDPAAKGIIVQFGGIINGIITSATSPITTGSAIAITPNPLIP